MKIKEFLNKYKDQLLIISMITALSSVIVIAGNSCTDEEIKEEQAFKQEEQINPQQPKEEVEEEQEPEITPPVEENVMSDVEMARQLIEPSIADTIGDLDYALVENDGQLILVLDLKAEELSYVTEKDWSDLKANAIYAQTSWQDVFDSAGLKVQFCVFVGDIDRDRMYLAVTSGQIIYDVFNESSNDLELKNM